MCSADTQNELKKVHEKFIKTSENPLQLSINATEQHWGSSSGTAAGQTTLLHNWILSNFAERVQSKQGQQKAIYDVRARSQVFNVGNTVYTMSLRGHRSALTLTWCTV